MSENLVKQAKNILTHAEAYNIIGECESVWKCQAKAPAKHFEDKKQDTPVVARFMSVAGHLHEEPEEQPEQSKDKMDHRYENQDFLQDFHGADGRAACSQQVMHGESLLWR